MNYSTLVTRITQPLPRRILITGMFQAIYWMWQLLADKVQKQNNTWITNVCVRGALLHNGEKHNHTWIEFSIWCKTYIHYENVCVWWKCRQPTTRTMVQYVLRHPKHSTITRKIQSQYPCRFGLTDVCCTWTWWIKDWNIHNGDFHLC